MRVRQWLGRIGPAFIVGACIIGPGSVTLMSKTGAAYGYSLLWVSLLAGAVTCGFIALFMRLGIRSEETFLQVVRRRVGRAGPLFAAACGVSLASTDAAFQFGNCLGVATGMDILIPGAPRALWPILFTTAAIVFLFSLRSIYRAIERMMALFLVLMLAAFAINLVVARPDLGEMAKGALIPSWPEEIDWVTLGGLVATTFVLVAVIFQSYVVQAKGWGPEDYGKGVTDTLLASIIVTLLGAVMMSTAAAVLHPRGIEIESADDLALQLQGAFGRSGQLVFGVGFASAAFSSFVTNSLIGGTLLNDGLGYGGRLDSLPTKIFASLVLIAGLAVSLLILRHSPEESGKDPRITAIAVGQAATLLAVPLGAVATVIALFDRKGAGGRALGPLTRAFVLLGILVLLGLTVVTYVKLVPLLRSLLG